MFADLRLVPEAEEKVEISSHIIFQWSPVAFVCASKFRDWPAALLSEDLPQFFDLQASLCVKLDRKTVQCTELQGVHFEEFTLVTDQAPLESKNKLAKI